MSDSLPSSAVRLYCDLMEEVKRRTEVIQNVVHAQIPDTRRSWGWSFATFSSG